MMSNKKAGWKLIRTENTLYEEVEGRRHNWHFHPEIFPDATTYMVKVRVSPGEGHDFHVHPQMDEILYVLRGCAEQWIEDEKVEMEEGDSVYIKSNIAHATFNNGKEDLEFLAILFPPEGWEAGTVDVSDRSPYSTYRQ